MNRNEEVEVSIKLSFNEWENIIMSLAGRGQASFDACSLMMKLTRAFGNAVGPDTEQVAAINGRK